MCLLRVLLTSASPARGLPAITTREGPHAAPHMKIKPKQGYAGGAAVWYDGHRWHIAGPGILDAPRVAEAPPSNILALPRLVDATAIPGIALIHNPNPRKPRPERAHMRPMTNRGRPAREARPNRQR